MKTAFSHEHTENITADLWWVLCDKGLGFFPVRVGWRSCLRVHKQLPQPRVAVTAPTGRWVEEDFSSDQTSFPPTRFKDRCSSSHVWAQEEGFKGRLKVRFSQIVPTKGSNGKTKNNQHCAKCTLQII